MPARPLLFQVRHHQSIILSLWSPDVIYSPINIVFTVAAFKQRVWILKQGTVVILRAKEELPRDSLKKASAVLASHGRGRRGHVA